MTCVMRSMRRTVKPYSGLSGMSGPVARSLRLTATATGPLHQCPIGGPRGAAHRALMRRRLIALDKQLGIRPVGVGENWRRMMANCLLRVAGPEAKADCGTKQLARGLEAGIEGAIHAMLVLWDEHKKEEDWCFLLITRATRSMRRTGQTCSGLSGTSGPVARSLYLTDTATGKR